VGDGLDIDLRADLEEPKPAQPPPSGGVVGWIVEQIKGWGPALLAVFVIRSIIVEPFQIPSGSMVPTLAIGDFILVSKFTYGLRIPFTDIEVLGLGEPERGDVSVFLYPPHLRGEEGVEPGTKTDYIKRIVGLPGDTVEVRDDVVFINGIEQARTFLGEAQYTDQSCLTRDMRSFEEDLSGVKHAVYQDSEYGTRMADWPPPCTPDDRDRAARGESSRVCANGAAPITIPEGHYFVMGDNRDHSADSRVWDFVPRANIRGKALFVWLSFDGCDGNIRALGSLRWRRIGQGIR
jgi:signal peptidase I